MPAMGDSRLPQRVSGLTSKRQNLTYLQFTPGVELLQAVDRLLSVYHRGHTFSLLEERRERRVVRTRAGRDMYGRVYG